jgi:hypothetical protein
VELCYAQALVEIPSRRRVSRAARGDEQLFSLLVAEMALRQSREEQAPVVLGRQMAQVQGHLSDLGQALDNLGVARLLEDRAQYSHHGLARR